MLENVLEWDAMMWINMEHSCYEILCQRGHGIPVSTGQGKVTFANPCQNVVWRVCWTICKWRLPVGYNLNQIFTFTIDAFY